MSVHLIVLSIFLSGFLMVLSLLLINHIINNLERSKRVCRISVLNELNDMQMPLIRLPIKFKLTDTKGKYAVGKKIDINIINNDRGIFSQIEGISNEKGICTIRLFFDTSGEYIVKAISDDAIYESKSFKVGIKIINKVKLISDIPKEICQDEAEIRNLTLKLVDENGNSVEFHDVAFDVLDERKSKKGDIVWYRSDIEGIINIKPFCINKSGIYSFRINAIYNEFIFANLRVIIDKVDGIILLNDSDNITNRLAVVAPTKINQICATIVNADKIPLNNKKVVFALLNYTTNKMIYNLVSDSNNDGNVVFSGIEITHPGKYECYITCEDVRYNLGTFSVFHAERATNIRLNSNRTFINYTGVPARIPIIEATICNDADEALYGKEVTLFLKNSEESSEVLSGKLTQKSSDKGYVKFENIAIRKVGEHVLCIACDDAELLLPSFHVAPRGLDIDFENMTYGTDAYWDALLRITRMTKSEDDKITIIKDGIKCQI